MKVAHAEYLAAVYDRFRHSILKPLVQMQGRFKAIAWGPKDHSYLIFRVKHIFCVHSV
jgi:hypothetical protein